MIGWDCEKCEICESDSGYTDDSEFHDLHDSQSNVGTDEDEDEDEESGVGCRKPGLLTCTEHTKKSPEEIPRIKTDNTALNALEKKQAKEEAAPAAELVEHVCLEMENSPKGAGAVEKVAGAVEGRQDEERGTEEKEESEKEQEEQVTVATWIPIDKQGAEDAVTGQSPVMALEIGVCVISGTAIMLEDPHVFLECSRRSCLHMMLCWSEVESLSKSRAR